MLLTCALSKSAATSDRVQPHFRAGHAEASARRQ